jgi:hypothetical protein
MSLLNPFSWLSRKHTIPASVAFMGHGQNEAFTLTVRQDALPKDQFQRLRPNDTTEPIILTYSQYEDRPAILDRSLGGDQRTLIKDDSGLQQAQQLIQASRVSNGRRNRMLSYVKNITPESTAPASRQATLGIHPSVQASLQGELDHGYISQAEYAQIARNLSNSDTGKNRTHISPK